MGDDWGADRPSVLGSPDLANASNRVIAAVVGTCVVGALLLAMLIAYAWSIQAERSMPSPPGISKHRAPPIARAPGPAPLRGDVAAAFSPDDYPAEALQRGEQGRTVAALTVDATGRPVSCRITSSSGSRALDSATCRVARTKVRYSPARDADGRAIPSSTTLPVRWVLPEEPSEHDAPPSHEAWWPLLLGAFAAFEAWTLQRGIRIGRMSAPRGSHVADRTTAPRLFWTYAALHALFAIACGGMTFAWMFGQL